MTVKTVVAISTNVGGYFSNHGGHGCKCIINPQLLRVRSEGYCSRFVCVCVCCNVLREMLDVNVKVEVRTQYKSKEP